MKTFNAGGIERSTINYSNHLAEKIKFVGICGYGNFFNHSNIISEKVKVFQLSKPVNNSKYFFSNLFCVIKIIVNNKINCIHYHHRIFLPYIILIKMFYRDIKIFYTHHSIFDDKLTRWIKSDFFIALNKSTEEELKKSRKSPIVIIPHGIEISQNDVKKKDQKIKTIGFVGRFDKSKGIFTLLESFRELKTKYTYLKLSLIGEGEQYDDIIDYINHNKITDGFSIKESAPYLNAIYSEIDLLVIPSISLEGFGLVILEAMLLKIPVIASDLAPIKEIIYNYETGLLFKSGDQNDLSEKLEMIINDPRLTNKISENGFQLIKDKYNIARTVSRYIDIYNSAFDLKG